MLTPRGPGEGRLYVYIMSCTYACIYNICMYMHILTLCGLELYLCVNIIYICKCSPRVGSNQGRVPGRGAPMYTT